MKYRTSLGCILQVPEPPKNTNDRLFRGEECCTEYQEQLARDRTCVGSREEKQNTTNFPRVSNMHVRTSTQERLDH